MENRYGDNPKKHFTRDEYYRMAECGVLRGGYELIEGEIWKRMPQNPPHTLTLKRLAKRLIELFGYDFLRLQSPILADERGMESEPEPDIVVATHPDAAYETQHPGANDLQLVVEISASTQRQDLSEKAILYAWCGIVEYGVIDLDRRRAVVHRSSSGDGDKSIEIVEETGSLTCLARPNDNILLSEIFSSQA